MKSLNIVDSSHSLRRTVLWSGALLALMMVMMLMPCTAFASAVLLDVRGAVVVKLPGGKAPQVKVGIELPDGSTVSVKSGGRAQLLLQSGALEEVAAGSTLTVRPNASSGKRTSLGSGVVIAAQELSQRGSEPTVHGMVKEAGGRVRHCSR